MEKNIFEGAKFGDKYITRDGKIALFWKITEDGEGARLFYSNGEKYRVFLDGNYHDLSCFTNPEDYLTSIDVVNKYEVTIDEHNLDLLATSYYATDKIPCSYDNCKSESIESFKIGYRAGSKGLKYK